MAQGTSEGPKRSTFREYFESLAVAFILALFIRTFVVQAFKIPSSSMEPNLLVGDHLLVNKFVFSPSWGAWEDALSPKRSIRRFDVVVFKFPKEPEKDFIKRVIGLPGEEVEVRDKIVYIDGQALDDSAYAHFLGSSPHRGDSEMLGEGADPEWPRRTVPDGQLFVMGDNRDNSLDSRAWGFLPINQVKGRALLVYWSYKADKKEFNRSRFVDWLWDILTAPGRTRWRRFFHLVR